MVRMPARVYAGLVAQAREVDGQQFRLSATSAVTTVSTVTATRLARILEFRIES